MPEAPQRHYGGQALIEGVMIRGAKHVCVACRQLDSEGDGTNPPPSDSPVFVQTELISTFAGRFSERNRAARWPLIRGSLVLLESMELGAKGLRLSATIALGSSEPKGKANAARADDEPRSPAPSAESSSAPAAASSGRGWTIAGLAALCLGAGAAVWAEKAGIVTLAELRIGLLVAGAAILALSLLFGRASKEEYLKATSMGEMAVGATMALGLTLGIGIFFVLPSLAVEGLRGFIPEAWALNLMEGFVRVALFFGYLVLIARLPNIKRIFQYHGAEHQVIHAYEEGLDLTPENAARFSTVHPRCGTAFLAIVLVTSVILFAFAGWQHLWLRLILRVAFLPLIAVISYELLKLNSRRPNFVLNAFVAPGLWFQKITTQPPTRDQVEVAIAALMGVLAAERVAG